MAVSATTESLFPLSLPSLLHTDLQTTTTSIINIAAVVTDNIMDYNQTFNDSSNQTFINDTGIMSFTTDTYNYTSNSSDLTSNISITSIPIFIKAETYIVPILCAVGVILNVLNLLVLTERYLKESPYTYLTAMAILCLASLTMSLVYYVLLPLVGPHRYYFLVYTFLFYYPCVNICTNSTMWVTALLTIERFCFVRHPLWARAKCDRRSAKMKICVVIILMMLINIPRFFQYCIVPHHNGKPGYYEYNVTDFRQSYTFLVITWLYSVVIQFIPMTILCLINFYLVYAIHRSRKLRQQMQIRNNMEARWSREQTRLTLTLVAIVFFFLICIIPSSLSDRHVAYAIFGGGMEKKDFLSSNFYYVLQKVTNFLVFSQLSFNFILYSLFNDKFLAVFRRMLRRWADRISRRIKAKRHRHNNNSVSHSSSVMLRLMRIDTMTMSTSSMEKNGHCRVQLKTSNNSMSSQGKQSTSSGNKSTTSSGRIDGSQTKSSLLELC